MKKKQSDLGAGDFECELSLPELKQPDFSGDPFEGCKPFEPLEIPADDFEIGDPFGDMELVELFIGDPFDDDTEAKKPAAKKEKFDIGELID